MSKSLAVKYRPKSFSDVVGQSSTKAILENQLATNTIKNAYLFCGSAGTGKTTCARIFANEINGYKGIPIEIDAASHSSVNDVREIVNQAQTKSIDSEYKIFIIDECFPADTWIKTDKSYKAIKDIRVGDIVQSMSGYNKVTHIFKSSVLTSRLCCVIINNKKIITTAEHLFFTNNGWVKACDLCEGDIVYDSKSLSELWKEFSNTPQGSEVLLSPLFSRVPEESLSTEDENSKMSDMWQRISDTELVQDKDLFCGVQEQTDYEVEYTTSEYRIWQGTTETIIRAYEEEQSNEGREEHTDNVSNKREEWYTSSMESTKGWKREVYHTTDSLIRSIRRWLDFRIRYTDKMQEGRTSVSYVLQSRPWLSNNENCNRGRWQKPQREKWIIERCKEREMPNRFRVDSVEIYKRGDNDELFRSSFTDTELSQKEIIMYDLEVENDHTYFANNILVHNCHSLSTTGWQAFLKLLEEPPAKTIFIFATTDPQKIPKTILSRVQRYNFQRIPNKDIYDRLVGIIDKENDDITYELEALSYITALANGGMRDAITMLDKCISHNKHLTLDSVVEALNKTNPQTMVELCEALLGGEKRDVIEIIEEVHNSGADLKVFIKEFTDFLLDVCKYILTNSFEYTMYLSEYNKNWLRSISSSFDLITSFLDKMTKLNSDIKYSDNPKYVVEATLILLGGK